MKNHSRRKFVNSIVGGSFGIGALPLFSFSPKAEENILGRRELPVINEVDICVLGGSCTGVFAAVRASRLGAHVAIVEKQNAFGGVATNGLVNIWHSLYNTEANKQIIAGLTAEVIERLSKRDAVIFSDESKRGYFTLNTQELKIELDELVLTYGITPYLHTLFSEPYLDGEGKLTGIIIDNKSGRGIIWRFML
jgi:thioredoxin reductase